MTPWRIPFFNHVRSVAWLKQLRRKREFVIYNTVNNMVVYDAVSGMITYGSVTQ
jgi:hypothetical protein